MKNDPSGKVSKEVLKRLQALAAQSMNLTGVMRSDQNPEFDRLLAVCRAQGMTFDGLSLIQDDGCPLCFEDRKLIVYQALTAKTKQKPSVLQSVTIGFGDAPGDSMEEATLH